MNQRIRLVELLFGYSLDTIKDVEYVADHLIAQNVLALPCPIGTPVWALEEMFDCSKCPKHDENDYCDNSDNDEPCPLEIVQEEFNVNEHLHRFNKTVFLSETEANIAKEKLECIF